MSAFKAHRSAGLVGLCLLASLALAPAHVSAAPDCSAYSNANAMSWPDTNPVWEFCWRRPEFSAPGPDGSGIEFFDVTYNGHLVFDRVNVPILNVEYGPGGCGCFRDWLDSDRRFEAIGEPCGNGYCEVTQPPRTVCDCAPTNQCDANPNNACNQDVGSFEGVAAEKLADRLIMTGQTSAGWYRYHMKWTFHLDGTIDPEFGFAATPNGCTDATHVHHAYFRFDFDIDDPAGDYFTSEIVAGAGSDGDGDGVDDNLDNCTTATNSDQRDTNGDGYGNACDADLNNDGEINFGDLAEMKAVFLDAGDLDADLNGDGSVNFGDLALLKSVFLGTPGPSALNPEGTVVTAETADYATPGQRWVVRDASSGRGYRLIPGDKDHLLAPSTFDPVPFAAGDYWLLVQKSDEIDDGNNFGGTCEAELDNFVDGENVDGADVVMFYRVGTEHIGLDECFCGRIGPSLIPVGDWTPAP